jgi:site-specific recombinase XerD
MDGGLHGASAQTRQGGFLRSTQRCRYEGIPFLDEHGCRFPYHRLRRLVHAWAVKADLDGPVTPHTFRRSCTTEMLRAGAGMYHVKELLGHESLDTLQHYARLTIVDLKKTHRQCHPRERDEKVRGDG